VRISQEKSTAIECCKNMDQKASQYDMQYCIAVTTLPLYLANLT